MYLYNGRQTGPQLFRSRFRTVNVADRQIPLADQIKTSGSAMAEGPRDALVSRNSATTKYRYRVALFA